MNLGIGLSISSAVKVATPPPAESSLLNGLVAAWLLADHTASVGPHDLTIENGVTFVDGHAHFEAALEQALEAESDSDLQTGDVSFVISCRVRLGQKTNFPTFYTKGGAITSEYALWLNTDTDRFSFSVNNGVDVPTVEAETFGSPSLNTWYRLIGWRDKDAGLIGISVEGDEDTLETAVIPATTADGVYLGAAGYPGGYYDLDLQHCHFWKGRVLSGGEKSQIMAGAVYPFT